MRDLRRSATPKTFLTSLATALLLATPVAAQEDAAPTHGIRETVPGHVAFVHATVIVSPERTVEDATLVVHDGRVVSVAAGGDPPAGARVIDLGGKRIYPGFVDPYTEYGLPEEKEERGEGGFGGRTPPQYEGDRSGARAWNEAIHAERDWIDAFQPDAKAAEPLLERGVTTAQSVRQDGIFRGRGFVTTLADGEPNEVVLVSRTTQFLSFDKGSSPQAYPSSLMGAIALFRQTLLDADWYEQAQQAEGDELPAVNRALAAVAALEGPVVFETEDPLSLLRAARLGEEFGISLIHVGGALAFERVTAIAAFDSPLILPLSFPEEPDVGTYETALDTSLQDLRRWERAPTTPAVLAEQGVRFAFTGHGLKEEEDFFANLRKAVEMGLAEATALAALTTIPADLVGIGDEAGTLEPGRRADLVIASGDLLRDEKAKVQAVWIGGEEAKAFEDVESTDFRGRWAWTVAGRRLEVEVGGSPAKPTVELVEGEEKESLDGVETTRGTLTFRAPWNPVAAGRSAGVARFSLRGLDDALFGQVALPDGRLVTATVERLTTEVADEEEEKADTGKEAPEALLSHLTHPNVAFGYDQRPQPETVLVRNATIWTNEEAGVLEGADLLIRDGKFAAVGRDLDAPSGAREIDATGKHVTAGIIDEHSHIAITGGVNEGSHAATAEVRIGDVVDPDDISIYRSLAGGTTAAQLLHGSANPIGGQAQVVKLRWGADAEGMKFAAAPPTIKFALGENVKQSNWGDVFTDRYPQTRMGVEAFLRDRFLAAQEYAAAQAAWTELSDRQRRGRVAPRRDLQLETLAEILAGERLVHCHSYVQSEVLMLIRLAEEMGFTVKTFTHILEGYKVAPEMAAHGAGGSTFSDWWAYKFEVYDAIPTNACLMHRAGVVTSLNSDSDDLIRRLNTEAGKMVAHCDLGEQEALKMVTLYPAMQLEIDDRVGSLAAGKDADFVIWSGHPLSEYSRAEQTWVDGMLMFSLERDAALRERIRTERAALIQKILEEEPAEGDEKDGDKPGEEEPASPPAAPAQALLLGLAALPRRRVSQIRWRPALAFLLALSLVGSLAGAYDPIPGEPQTRPVLLQGGDLYTVSQGVLAATDLLFEDGKITAIGKRLTPPPEAEVIDVSGQRVYPGLIALSTTIGLVEIEAVRSTRDLDETGSVNPEVMASVAYDPDSEIIPTVRSEGITTVQVAPQGDLVRGRSAVLHLDGWTREDAGVEPVDGLFLSWPRAAVIDAWWMDETPEEQRKQMAEQRAELRQTFELARAYDKARDADASERLREGAREQGPVAKRQVQDLRWESMRPLWSGDMPLYVRADDYRQILEAVQLAGDFGLRMVLIGGAEAGKVADLLARRQIPVVVDSTSGLPYRSEADYDLPGRLPKVLHDAGVTVAIALLDNSWAVRNLAIEGAGRAVAFGLPYEAALRAVTSTPAEILGIDDREGSLAVGKDATLIVSSGDVLDTLGHQVTHMWIAGRAVDLGNKQKELYRKYRTKIERYAQ